MIKNNGVIGGLAALASMAALASDAQAACATTEAGKLSAFSLSEALSDADMAATRGTTRGSSAANPVSGALLIETAASDIRIEDTSSRTRCGGGHLSAELTFYAKNDTATTGASSGEKVNLVVKTSPSASEHFVINAQNKAQSVEIADAPEKPGYTKFTVRGLNPVDADKIATGATNLVLKLQAR